MILTISKVLVIQMFCEEKSHFLEIADVIRSLGLSILKGVMESRSEKTWARFIVEVLTTKDTVMLLNLVEYYVF